ncbi:hypothetical protein ABJ851_003919 [Shigella flexneri]|nr:hypothetical protein [Escherichia coli]
MILNKKPGKFLKLPGLFFIYPPLFSPLNNRFLNPLPLRGAGFRKFALKFELIIRKNTMFKIIIIRETPLGIKDEEDLSVSEAIYSTYADYTDDILMVFDKVVLCLDRRSDVSDIYNDIVDIFEQLELGTKQFFMCFLSSSFTTRWEFEITSTEVIKITAHWFVVRYLYNINSDIKVSVIEIPISEFKAQWGNIIKPMKRDILSLGYDVTLENFSFFDKFN